VSLSAMKPWIASTEKWQKKKRQLPTASCHRKHKQAKHFPVSLSESFCVTEDDFRWLPMCNHVLNKRGSHGKDSLLGTEECQSPFGIYELSIPVDKKLACGSEGIKDTNCKDLDVSYS